MTRMTAKMRAASQLRTLKANYPHQAALPDDFCAYENFTAIRRFCEERFGHPAATFSVTARWEDGGDQTMRVHCFATLEEAAQFRG